MTNIPTTILINSYFILESLEDDRTTLAIGKVIDRLRDKDNTLFYYVKIKNKLELLNAIGKITNIENSYPLIHIAAHGNYDGSGIRLLEDEINWFELTKELSILNTRTKNNTILIMALCKGAKIITEFDKGSRAPYFLMLGPTYDINWNKLDRYLFEFYKKLIPTFDLSLALEEIRNINGGIPPFYYLNSVGEFQKFVQKIKEDIDKGKLRHYFLERYKEKEGIKASWELKAKIDDKEYQKILFSEALDIYKTHWFMIDLYPENKERFQNVSAKIE